jgi:hypothetical protein
VGTRDPAVLGRPKDLGTSAILVPARLVICGSDSG